MKLRLSLSLRRCLLACYAAAVATLGSLGTYAGTLHEDVSLQTYTDFGQNMGRYVTGGHVNALLSHIRSQEGITITYTGGQSDYRLIPTEMVSFDAQADNGASIGIGFNFLATVEHNGVQNPTFTSHLLPAGSSVQYNGIEYRDSDTFLLTPSVDYKITRLSKVVTDVDMATLYTGTVQAGDLLYRAGSGNMTVRDKEGNIRTLRGPYNYITGGITSAVNVETGADNNRVVTNFDYTAAGISDAAPLPVNGDSGDSGSPVLIWNETTGRYEYVAAMQSVNAVGGAGVVTSSYGAAQWSQEKMDAYSKQVNVQAAGQDVFVSGQMTQGASLTDNHGRTGELWTGAVQDASGNTLLSYNGVKSGVNTWNSLSSLKDDDKWYAYGAEYLNANEGGTDGKMSMATLFRTENLVFTSVAAENTVRIDADGVDLGVGYAQFSRTGSSPVSYTVSGGAFNHAGYIVDEGVAVHLSSANMDAANMREWRKVGAGDLYIEGTGNNEVMLNLGGKGTTYLNEKEGYAAYNVLANTGTRVVLNDVNQIARDFTFGNGGAVLDFNGHSMTWNNGAEVKADGFSIHALTEEAVITNGGNTAVTLRVTNGGDTFLGSFRDTATADLNIVYAGEGNWNLHSIATDLTHGNSGFTVESGSVTLSGTQTVHAIGSESGTNDNRLSRDNDCHYADAAMNVAVQGGTFTLGSHARLEGDVTVANGGTFVMNEAVQHQMEYVEGGSRLENTDKYAAFVGLKGDVTLNGGAMRVEFSKDTDATTTYGGSISGNGALTVATGNGTIHLAGDNSAFSGTRTVENGTVSFADTAAMGDTSHTWLVQENGVLVMPDSDDFSVIDTASTGVIALSRDTAVQALSTLDIGAADGATVHYGTADTALESADGKWVLGGGGGNLVVDFRLEGANQLVLGNGHSTGTVTLTNTANSFTGGVVLNQGIRLDCTDNAALGGSKLRIDYGALAAVHGDTSILDAASQGAALVDSSPRTDWNLTNTPNLSLAADGDVYFSGALTVANGADYHLGGASGTLTMATALGGAHGLVVDGQGSTGGKVILARTATLTGNVTVQGYDADRASAGDITLSFTAAHALDAAASVTVRNNAVIDLNGTEQSFRQLSLDSSSAIIDSSARRTGTLSFATTTAAGLDGHVDVGALHIDNADRYTVSSSVTADRLVKEGIGALQVADPTRFGSMEILGGSLQFACGYNVVYNELTVRNASVAATTTTGYFAQFNGNLILGDNAVINSGHYAINGSVTVEDAATATFAHPLTATRNVTLNATLTMGEGSVLKLAEATNSLVLTNRVVNEGGQGTIQLLNHALYLGDMKAKDTQRIGGELKVSANSTLHSMGANAGVTRSFEHLSVDAGKTATLITDTDKVATTWQADKLTGEGSVVLDTRSGSKLVLTGESSVASISGNTAVELQGANVSSNLSGSLHLDSYGNSTLSGNNTYTGTTTVQNGTLTLMSEHALGGAAVSFTRGTLALGADTSVTALQGANGAVALNNHTLSLTGTNPANFAGAISGGNLTAVGTGQTLSGAVQLDSLNVAQGAALNITNGAELGSVTLAKNAALTLNGTVALHGGITGGTGSTLTLGGDIKVSLNYEDFTNGSFTIYSSTGNLAGTALTKDNILVDGLTGTQLGADRFTLQSFSNAVIVTVSDFSHELTWAGAQGLEEWNLTKSNWTNDKGESVVFRNGDRVTLGGSGSSIAVDSGIKAGSLTIAEGRHTLKTNTLQVSHDVIIESGSLDLSSDGDISVGGKVHIGTGAKLIYNYGSHTIDYGVEMENGASLEVNSGAKLDVRTDSHIADMTVYGTVSQNGKMYLDNLTVSNLDGLGVLTSAAMNINGVELEQARLASGGLNSLGKPTRTTLVLTSEGNAAVVSGTGGSQLTLYNAGSSMFSATNLTITEDHALKLDLQTLKLNINGGSFVNRGELIVDTAATIAGGTFDTAGGTITANADLNLKSYSFTGNGNLNVLLTAAKSGEGTISINGNNGTASVLMGDADINAKLAVSNGLEVNSWMTDYKNSTLHIKESGQLTVTDKALRVESSAIVSVEGGMLDAQAGITLGHTQATNPGHLAMESGSITTTGIELVNSGNSFTMSGGKLTVTGDKLFTGSGQASLAISGGTLAATTSSWELNHDVILGDVSVETAAGKTISFTGQTILTSTLHNAGSISFAMEDVSGMEEVTKLLLAEGENWETTRTYRDRVSGSDVNGFATTNYLLIAGSEGSTVNFNGRETISVNGSDYTLRTDGSSAWYTDGEQDTREYVVNSGTLHFGAADNAAEDGNHIRMNGGALSIEKDLNGRGVTIAANQAVNVAIGENVAVQSAELYTEQGGSISLSGEGLYELAEGALALNSNVSLADDWSGTVAVSMSPSAGSAHIASSTLNALTNEHSAVQLSGMHGYLDWQTNNTYVANLVLENSHFDYALQLNESSSGRSYDFRGKVSGAGDWRLGQGMVYGGNTYTFSGDVSGWTGSFISDANVSNTLAFSRENGVVNAAIVQTGTGALNVTTNAETTFNADVTIGGVMTLGGLAHNNADMNLSGGLAVSGNWVQFTTDYDAVSGDTQNGFSRGYLVLGGAGASLSVGSQSAVTIGGQSYDLHTGNGSAWVGGSDYAVNTRVVFGTDANDTLSATALTLNNGAELVLSADLGERTVNVAANAAATVNIAENVQMKAASLTIGQGGIVSLAGSGEYALNSGASALTSDVALSGDWDGVVRISNYGNSGMNVSEAINTLGNKGTTVGLTGVNGWISQNGTVSADLNLKDSDETAAFTISNGYKGSLNHFSGTISGDGTLRHDWAPQYADNYSFDGDISSWTGVLENKKGMMGVVFTDKSSVVNAEIRTGAGADLAVTTKGKHTTFNKTVNATSLSAEGDVTFNANATLGTLAENGHAVSLGKDTDLTLSQTIAGHATSGGNDDSSATVDLLVNGDEGSSLHLNMNTNTGWQQNNTIRVQAEAGKESVRDIYVSGAMAYDVFNGTAQTNLGSSNLHLADGSVLEIRKNQSANGINITSGDIVLAGTTEVNLYGNASADAKMSSAIRTESGQESTLKLTGGGGITLAKSVEVGTLQVSASNGVGLTDTATIADAYTVSGTEKQKAELEDTTLSGESLSGGSISNALIDLKEAVWVNLSNIILQNCDVEMKAEVGTNADFTGIGASGALTLTNTADGTDVRQLDADTQVQHLVMGNFDKAQLRGGSLVLTLNCSSTDLSGAEWLSVELAAPSVMQGIMAITDTDSETLDGVNLLMKLAEDGVVRELQGYITGVNQNNVVFFHVNEEIVPEPATSTLSLLALAVLCARRRRKA